MHYGKIISAGPGVSFGKIIAMLKTNKKRKKEKSINTNVCRWSIIETRYLSTKAYSTSCTSSRCNFSKNHHSCCSIFLLRRISSDVSTLKIKVWFTLQEVKQKAINNIFFQDIFKPFKMFTIELQLGSWIWWGQSCKTMWNSRTATEWTLTVIILSTTHSLV